MNETLRLRSAIDLPHRFIVLAQPSESLIVLDVESEGVIWCDNYDVPRLDDSSKMLGTPDTWPRYAEFFEFLLDEEEEERNMNREWVLQNLRETVEHMDKSGNTLRVMLPPWATAFLRFQHKGEELFQLLDERLVRTLPWAQLYRSVCSASTTRIVSQDLM